MTDERLPDIVPEICSCAALRQATRHVTQFYDTALAPSGVGLNQYTVLSRLDRVAPVAMQDLARLLVMDRSTLGHLLRPLQRRRLVTLTIDRHDRRSRILALTAAGRRVLGIARPLWAAAERRFAGSVGEGRARDLRSALKRLATTDFGQPADTGGPTMTQEADDAAQRTALAQRKSRRARGFG